MFLLVEFYIRIRVAIFFNTLTKWKYCVTNCITTRPLYNRVVEMVNYHAGMKIPVEGQEYFTIIQYNKDDEYTYVTTYIHTYIHTGIHTYPHTFMYTF